ncbi:E3 SUMO-protein ligase RanBP2 [Sitophilus oryzae]|uniref:E3 SUMO-protein ligase RanBP2 n=1 Tax=Sitophilus oryzae TaxID=7048 RepID=A0A6J2YT74_SITOR|nr:E3 SUMO-protein ligase RanBP2 [Sitophilus oryzae]
MFQSRQEVDKHVNNSLLKVNNETERNLRCFSFAKLYFNVGDYEQAVRYVTSYLSVKPKSAEGHNLLGKALEKLGKKNAALEAYRTSLQQNPKQNNLVIKVCELMAQHDVEVDNARARYFCDLAQSLDPQNPVILSLKEKIITNDGKDPKEVSQFLIKELEIRPTDLNLRVRLLKHFLQNNMIKEAFKHASDIEEKKLDLFDNSLPWYETFAEVLVKYQKETVSSQLSWEFWFLSISVLEKLASLSMDDHTDAVKSQADYINSVFNFDQSLLKASQNVKSCPDKRLLKEFLNHYEVQLCFHLAVLAFKQAKKGLMGFKEVQSIVVPLLFISYNTTPLDIQGVWFNSVSESSRKIIMCWYKDGNFRCSQAGHILHSMAKDRRNVFIEKANQYSTGMWRDQAFKKLFITRDQQLKSATSYFISSSSLEPVTKLPEQVDLVKYDEVAQNVRPDSLHHYIWTALNTEPIHNFNLKTFDGLQYTIKNLTNCAAESLNVLDIQSFVLCAALSVRTSSKGADSSLSYFNQDKPPVLPACLTGHLGTLNQAKFVSAAYKMYKHEHPSNTGEIRLLLVRGIEVVRCVGNHGLDVKLLVHLAKIFEERANSLTKQSEIEANNHRAELYWKAALPFLEKLKNNYAIVYPKNRLFEYRSNKELGQEEVSDYLEKAKLFLGIQQMKKKEYEKAMHVFEGLKDPYASFYQSQMYKSMADSKTNQNKENVTSEMRSQNVILLSKARDCLYLTLDRLRDPAQDKDHPLNAQLGTEIDKIERLLCRFDPDCANRNECDGMSDENVSDSSVGEHYLSTYTHHASFQNGRDFSAKNDSHLHSTPLRLGTTRTEARPSPERLDAQLRQMMASKDLTMRNLIEQNRTLTELQRSLMEKHFVELTHTMDDRLQNVIDMVQGMKKEMNEIRKEINEIKKNQIKNTQLSDEDLYVLDPDYSSALDYNLGTGLSNPAPNINPVVNNMYPPQYNPARLQGQTLLPGFGAHAPWSAGYFGMPYPYGPMGLQAPPFLPPADQQQQLSQLGLVQPPYQQPMNLNLGSLMAAQVQNAQMPAKDSPKTALNLGTQSAQNVAAAVPLATTKEQVPKPAFSGGLGAVQAPLVSNSKAPPVNVVITSSDPLPSIKSPASQPVLSVTIPPQHIKGNIPKPVPVSTQPHNYQIPLPASNAVASTPSVLSKPAPVISTQSLLSGIPSPAISAIVASPNVSLGLQIEKSLEETFPGDKSGASLNRSNASAEEYDPRPDFKPIIPLPDEVPVTTGEEKETELFCQRAKLFRHVTTNEVKEWKERGVGNIKILHNPETGKVRVLMRRDQVHKICANHFLTKDMVLTPNTKNEKAYLWAAHDYADGEMVLEKFCVRFKTAEEAKQFAEAFEKAKNKITDAPAAVKSVTDAPKGKQPEPKKADELPKEPINMGGFKFTSTPTFKPMDEAKPVQTKPEERKEVIVASPFASFSFGAKAEPSKPATAWDNFWKPPAAGSWKCAVCEVVNKEADSKCVACETSKDGKDTAQGKGGAQGLKGVDLDTGGQTFSFGIPAASKPLTAAQTQKSEQPVQKFSFSVPPANKPDPSAVLSGFGDSFKPKSGTWECKTCYIRNEPSSQYCLSCETPKDDTVPKKETAPKGVNLETPGLKFNFGVPTTSTPATVSTSTSLSTPKSTFSFGSTLATTTEPVSEKSASESKSQQGFVFGSPHKHDFEFKPRSPRRISSGQGDESDGSYMEEEEANVYFKPVVPLPDKIDVKTGEENEEVLYCHRAKLFRFSAGEWKERGLGDVKILKDNVSGKLRVVMRREQVLKICLNHWLTKTVEYLPKDDRTWLFFAPDFSEGEISTDQFCLRFKTPDIAKEFKTATENAIKDDVKKDKEPEPIIEEPESSDDSDVEFVSDTQVTLEEETDALKLGLPAKFFAYRQRPDCTCEQCKKEDEYLKELFGKEPDSKPESIKVSSTSSTVFGTPTLSLGTPSSGSVFGTPITSFTFSSTTPTASSPVVSAPKSDSLRDLLQKTVPIASEQTPKSGEVFKFKFGQASVETSVQNAPTPPTKSENIFQTSSSGGNSPFLGSGLFNYHTPKEGATPNLFGDLNTSKADSAGGLFESKKDSDAGKYTFGSSSSANLFGNSSAQSLFATQPTNIFGTASATTTSSANIFSSNSGSSDSSNIFSSAGNSSNIFSAAPGAASTGNIFSGTGVSTNTSLFGNAATQRTSGTSIFGGPPSIQGTPAKPSVLGTTIFGSKAEPKVTDANLNFGSSNNDAEEIVLNCDPSLSFSSLAAKVDPKSEPAFSATKTADATKPFSFLGAGAPVFGTSPLTRGTQNEAENNSKDGDDETGEQDDKEHDPHFEPIVPLPDQIVVSTGEENETVLFGERAKLYRYDANGKEWKERGVGQIKILHDPANGTYRLLLRREQVHKVVLNERIGRGFQLQQMNTSDRAWTWIGHNYVDDEFNMENLSVRFKNTEQALAFKKTVEEVVQKISDARGPSQAEYDGQEDQAYRVHHEDDYDDDEDEDTEDDEDDRSIMFSKNCTLSELTSNNTWQTVGMGELQLYYDPDIYAAKICVTDHQGQILTSSIIGINTFVTIEGRDCWYKTVEWVDERQPAFRTLKVTFSSPNAAQEFHSNYLEAVNFAQEVGIVDELPNAED